MYIDQFQSLYQYFFLEIYQLKKKERKKEHFGGVAIVSWGKGGEHWEY